MNFLEICEISPFLDNFLENGGSETLIFLRKNNDLGTGPPKAPLLAKFTAKLRNSPILLKMYWNVPKRREKLISGDFCGFRTDRTPPEPMNLLCISMVWGALGRPGARRGAFSKFHRKIKKIWWSPWNSWNFMEIQEKSWKSWKFVEILSFPSARRKHPLNL